MPPSALMKGLISLTYGTVATVARQTSYEGRKQAVQYSQNDPLTTYDLFSYSLFHTVLGCIKLLCNVLSLFETLVSFHMKAFFLLNRYPIMKNVF